MLPTGAAVPITLRIHALRNRLPDAARVVAEVLAGRVDAADDAGASQPELWMVGFPEAEELRVGLSASVVEALGRDGLPPLISTLTSRLAERGGSMSVARAPVALRYGLSEPSVETRARLASRIRWAFDPNGVLAASP
jgi:hypothetical protein